MNTISGIISAPLISHKQKKTYLILFSEYLFIYHIYIHKTLFIKEILKSENSDLLLKKPTDVCMWIEFCEET